MSLIEASVVVPAPVSEVFAYVSDWRRWHEWFVGLSDARPVADVPMGDGARYAYKVRIMGIAAGVVTEIASFVRNSGWNGISRKGVPGMTSWRFEAEGEQTRFKFGIDYRIPVPLLGPLFDNAFVRPQWVRILDASLANVKRHFELS